MWFHRHICRNKSINFASIDQFYTFKSEKCYKACACLQRINEKNPNKSFAATQMCGMSTEAKKACTYAQCTFIHLKPDFFYISIMDRTFKLLLNSFIYKLITMFSFFKLPKSVDSTTLKSSKMFNMSYLEVKD